MFSVVKSRFPVFCVDAGSTMVAVLNSAGLCVPVLAAQYESGETDGFSKASGWFGKAI